MEVTVEARFQIYICDRLIFFHPRFGEQSLLVVSHFKLRDGERHTGVPCAARPVIKTAAVRRSMGEGCIDQSCIRYSVDRFTRTNTGSETSVSDENLTPSLNPYRC
jgi:hypothetical protein